jgi:hypothetical protein
MRLTVRQISSLLAFCVLAACTGKPPVTSKTKEAKFNYQKVYYYSYDNVWRAAQLSLKYPIAVNNMDHGILETDYIKADDGFIAPVEEKVPSSGVRYKISLTLSKGKVEGRESVRVTITKLVEKKRDFFAETETLVSDGLEEKVIFYRMERELVIDDALKKAAARGQ